MARTLSSNKNPDYGPHYRYRISISEGYLALVAVVRLGPLPLTSNLNQTLADLLDSFKYRPGGNNENCENIFRFLFNLDKISEESGITVTPFGSNTHILAKFPK